MSILDFCEKPNKKLDLHAKSVVYLGMKKGNKTMKLVLNLNQMDENTRHQLLVTYPEFVETILTGKERSELTETRIHNFLNIKKPNTSEYDFDFLNERFELKQAEDYLTQPKFQQVKPYLYPYIICMLNGKERSRWYLLKTKNISMTAGKEHAEEGKLPLNRQHRNASDEGQIVPNAAFHKFAKEIGELSPLMYHKENLNLSDKELNQIFTKIEKIVR